MKKLLFIALALVLIVNVFALTEQEANSNNQLPQEIKEFTEETCAEDGCEEGIESFPRYNLTSCGVISSPGIYILQNNISSEGTCIGIDSSRVVLFCDNNYILHSRDKIGNGIQAKNVSRIMILSCNILQGNVTGTIRSNGIFMNDTSKSRVIDNTILSRVNDASISINGYSDLNRFAGNKIRSFGNGFMIEILGDSMNTLLSNYLETNGYDLYLSNSSENSRVNLINQRITRYLLPENGIYTKIIRKDIAEIDFLSQITGSEENGASSFTFENNFVRIRSDSNSGLDKPARITLMNLTLNLTDPVVFRDGMVCENCSNLTLPAVSSITFEVPGFGNYTIAERPMNNNSNQTIEEPQTIPQQISSGSTGCKTTWTCSDWSACTDSGQSGNPTQSRTCEKVSLFCYAGSKPAETQSCTIQNLAQELNPVDENNTFGSRITGAIVGVGQGVLNNQVALFLLLIIILAVLYYLLKKKYQNKKKKK